MTKLGKKILSAFVEVTDDAGQAAGNRPAANEGAGHPTLPDAGIRHAESGGAPTAKGAGVHSAQGAGSGNGTDGRFVSYFDKLFSDANIPGPDYYEFSKMIGAMQVLPDEQSRFLAAFAGLQVQGLDKDKLLSTANQYLLILASDADHFHTTVDATLQEKVHGRTIELKEKNDRIRALTQEISDLQGQIGLLQTGIQESEEKIEASTAGYTAESAGRRARVEADIEKIKHYIH